MDGTREAWWNKIIGRSSSIDTLNKYECISESTSASTFTNRSSPSVFHQPFADGEKKPQEQEVPKEIVDSFLKSVKFIDEQLYESPVKYAEDIVNDIIFKSKDILKGYNYDVQIKFQQPVNILWPKQGDFTVFLGLSSIDEYVGTWELDKGWKYFIALKKIRNGPFGTEYQYEVKFSYPTRRFPVPQATVSVYFFILLSPGRPWNSKAEVYFMVESMESKFIPGNAVFNQKWLEFVIDSKIHFFKQIRR